MAAIVVKCLQKAYGPVQAVKDVSMTVEDGEIVAMLGPNGAGKTTTVEILEGFHRRDGGAVMVLGQDPEHADRRFYERVGVVLQECEAEPYLTVTELVELYRGYYPTSWAADELVELVGLTDSATVRVRRLSGGQRRRLDLALALVGRPALVFMDEPTTGFDPEARRIAWDTIRELRKQGATILLTTHYLEEAEALADRVIVVVDGFVVADGTPASLGDHGRDQARISFRAPTGVAPAEVPVAVTVGEVTWSLDTTDPTKVLAVLTTWAVDRKLELVDLSVRRPSLEDVYLQLIA
jgi:ABC-2 type transport system ATP-binding protein